MLPAQSPVLFSKFNRENLWSILIIAFSEAAVFSVGLIISQGFVDFLGCY